MPKKSIDASTEPLDHPWIVELLESQVPHVMQGMPHLEKALKAGRLRTNYRPTLSPRVFYQWELWRCTSALFSCWQRLKHVALFMRRFPSTPTWERAGITRYDWLAYHYGYHELTCTTIGDVCLILTSDVFQLGLPHRMCTERLVLQNQWIRRHKVHHALKQVFKAIAALRQRRNIHLHRGQQTDLVDLVESQELDLVKMLGSQRALNMASVSHTTLQRLARWGGNKVLLAMMKDRIRLRPAVWHLLDELRVVSKSRAALLRD